MYILNNNMNINTFVFIMVIFVLNKTFHVKGISIYLVIAPQSMSEIEAFLLGLFYF